MGDDPTFAGAMLALASAAIGATAAIAGHFVADWIKKRRTRSGVASAFHAEISVLSDLTIQHGTVERWRKIADELERDERDSFPKIYAPDPTFGPVFDAHVGDIGLLSRDDSARIIDFYHRLYGIRFTLKSICSTDWTTVPNGHHAAAAQIRHGIGLWETCAAEKGALLASLLKTAKRA